MKKNTASREDITELHRKGYSLRVKVVKGRQYLSARKGGEEIGLGPCTQDLHELIEKLNKSGQSMNDTKTHKPSDISNTYTVSLHPSPQQPSPERVEFSKSEVDAALFDIKFERARVKMVDCEYSRFEFCQYWEFIKDSKRLESIYERFGVDDYSLPKISQHAQLKEETRDMLRVTELLCLDCEKYSPKKENQSV